jgi:hypothetical protein
MSTQTRTRRIGRRAFLGGSLVALLGAGSASAWALDTFVIDHVEVDNASSLTSQGVQAATASTTGTSTATSYRSDTAGITITKKVVGSGSETITYYVADVTVSDATIVRSAFAGEFGENIIADTSEIAEYYDAVFAINGDYYGFRDTGIVIRNGVLFRDDGARTGLAIYADGTHGGLRRDHHLGRGAARRRRVEHALVRAGARRRRRDRRRASRRSRSTPTSATTRSRASSPAPASG